jgi:hypothetical protein
VRVISSAVYCIYKLTCFAACAALLSLSTSDGVVCPFLLH